MDALTPREIVQELDKYIVGQDNAKRAVAIALRNRWRRQQLPPELRDEVAPKNIIMIGPTGVGKTEIAKVLATGLRRRLVRLQCYEGLDTAAAVYEWNYPRQMIEIRLAEAAGDDAVGLASHRSARQRVPQFVQDFGGRKRRGQPRQVRRPQNRTNVGKPRAERIEFDGH